MVVEFRALEIKMREGRRKVVDWLIEMTSKVQCDESLRECIHRFISGAISGNKFTKFWGQYWNKWVFVIGSQDKFDESGRKRRKGMTIDAACSEVREG